MNLPTRKKNQRYFAACGKPVTYDRRRNLVVICGKAFQTYTFDSFDFRHVAEAHRRGERAGLHPLTARKIRMVVEEARELRRSLRGIGSPEF